MARYLSNRREAARPGVALLVVIAMLALFAAVGLSFAFYAEFEADAARFYRQSVLPPDITDALDREKLIAFGLGQLIYGVDPAKYPGSKMAGNSLGESMYGIVGGTVPFNGVGRPRPDTTTPLDQLSPFEGINVPYTYPDINNPFLASIDAAGKIQQRTFFRNRKSLRPATLPLTDSNKPDEGDVRNYESGAGIAGSYVNDSFWMDLGHSIITAKDGTRFKPLFAFHVLDLDGRANLSVAGNYRVDYNNAGATTSRCGLGPFEMNLARILTTDKSEIQRLFTGSSDPASRYGGVGAGDTPDNAVTFPRTWSYSRVDYTGMSTSVPGLPTANYSQFPTFGAWADAVTQHPAGFDFFNSRASAGGAADVTLSASNTEGIFRFRDLGAPSLTNDLFKLLPKNLGPTTPSGSPLNNLVTPYSVGLDTALIAPFFVGDPNAKYQLGVVATDTYPKSTTVTQTLPLTLPAGTGDVSANFASRAAGELRRINLNRGFASAQDRIDMAQELFDRLVRVTGATPPGPNLPADPNDLRYKATRWLAQYAVNIVDFIDEDEAMTIFNWNPKANSASLVPGDYVFGVELNRLLINEAFATVDNDIVNDPGLTDLTKPNATICRINTWAELYNPMTAGSNNGGVATLAVGNQPVYRLLLAANNGGVDTSPTGLPSTLYYDDPSDPTKGVVDWPNNSAVQPGDQSARGKGFFLVGPPLDTILPERRPTWTGITWDHSSPGMSSKSYPVSNASAATPATAIRNSTLVLQRLADPTRAEQDDATKAGYNPFITVDSFVISTPGNRNNVKWLGTTDRAPLALGAYTLRGRYQPLQGLLNSTKILAPDPAYPATGQEPQHTFGRQNSKKDGIVAPSTDTAETLKSPFTVYYHHDRPLISPAELLMVPTVSPQQVTQRFAVSPMIAYPAFTDVNSLLFRFLETVTTGDRMFNKHLAQANNNGPAGTGMQAVVVPGKVNLNTIVDKSILQAIFDVQATDAQGKTFFTDSDVDDFWNDLRAITVTAQKPIAGFSDFALDKTTNVITMQNTLLESNKFFDKMLKNMVIRNYPNYNTALDATKRLNECERIFEHTEAMRKAMNSITFTSNSFAVWMTVGFFEVDSSGNVVAELGKAENRQNRHRMFSIVDRSQLVVPDVLLTNLANPVAKDATSATLNAMSGNVSATPTVKIDYPTWKIRSGMALTIDKGQVDQNGVSKEETVVVMQVTGPNSIQIGGFAKAHDANATVHFGGIRGPQVPLNAGGNGLVLGYPGPQPSFNPRDYSYVVPYYNLID